jgi:uncharacterized protein with PQ loop repeat
MKVLAIATTVWALAMAMSPSLQIRQMVSTGSARDVSIAYWVVLDIGFLLWVAYGISVDDKVVWIPNSVAAMVGITTLIVALVYRRRG